MNITQEYVEEQIVSLSNQLQQASVTINMISGALQVLQSIREKLQEVEKDTPPSTYTLPAPSTPLTSSTNKGI